VKQRVRNTGNEGINESVWETYVSTKARKLPISGKVVQEHTKYMAKRWGIFTLVHLMGG
jgi:hypothetical protein